MRFLHPEHDEHRELSLEDVFIVPGYFEGGSHPLVSANMNAVTGKRMAETMARYGGVGVLPQDMRLDTVARIVDHIKGADPRVDTALSVTRDATLRDVQGIIRKRSHGMVVVADAEQRPIGIITHADLKDRDQYTQADRFMSPRVVSISTRTDAREAFRTMEEHRLKAVPVVDDDGRLVGILGREAVVRMEVLEPSVDARRKLMVGAAVGISGDAGRTASRLVDIGVSVLVIDTAHGHQRRMLEAIRDVRAAVGGRVPIVAGNVCTADGTRALIEAGADIVKVNVGPGAMCTTRMQTGVGRPSLSSVLCCAREAHRHGKHVWADGGVRHPRDVALYLAAGASRVMIGTMLAGTYESPGDIKEDRDGRMYKENYGMASARAVSDRTGDDDAFDRAKKGFFREGISSSRIYLRDGFESVGAIVIDVISGVQSAFSYAGARTLQAFRESVVLGVQTHGGYHEGTPHGEVRE